MKYVLFKQLGSFDIMMDTIMETQFSQVHKMTYQDDVIYTYVDTYVDDLTVLFEDLSGELLSDFLVYISPSMEEKEVPKHIELCQSILKKMHLKRGVLSNRVILNMMLHHIDASIKKFILGKYHQQAYMIDTIKTYLEHNQNMMTASKELFIHRNTLMMRLDKFKEVTGFDVKTFYDGFLIYHLL